MGREESSFDQELSNIFLLANFEQLTEQKRIPCFRNIFDRLFLGLVQVITLLIEVEIHFHA